MSHALHGLMRFSKMHGAGNDFVVIDLRAPDSVAPEPALCRAMADRHTGIGCDQILTIEAPRSANAAAAYRIWNADGSLAGQCGNGARCVAAWMMRDRAERDPERCLAGRFELDSPAGTHAVEVIDLHHYRLDMGRPVFEPARIPLRGFEVAHDAYTLEIDGTPLVFGAVSMGNPHAVIEVDDVDTAAVATLGPALQRHAAFPDSVNVGFAQVVARDRVRLRVYERGVGETLACGSGACAAAAVMMRRGRVDREVAIELPGGTLHIAWPDDDATLTMAGPAIFVFEGEWRT
jgi:diaminopimelate epimerase